MTKLINSISRCYNTCINDNIHPFLAILFCIFCALIGLAIGLGINYLIALGLMYIYNTLAQNFNWPVFSIWFWFIGVLVFTRVLKAIRPSKEEE